MNGRCQLHSGWSPSICSILPELRFMLVFALCFPLFHHCGKSSSVILGFAFCHIHYLMSMFGRLENDGHGIRLFPIQSGFFFHFVHPIFPCLTGINRWKKILILNWTTISKIGILISFRYNAENSLQFVVYFVFLATHKILCFSPTILYAQHTIE